MSQSDPPLADNMKSALLHWFNNFGCGAGGKKVDEMRDLWREHLPTLISFIKNRASQQEGDGGVFALAPTSALSVYEEAAALMSASTESSKMAAYLDAEEAAKGKELEIGKFLLLFWHELCISNKQVIENSIRLMHNDDLQRAMGGAIEWMNNATENQDYLKWYYVLFECPSEVEGEMDELLPLDATTPTNSAADVSLERIGEETFTFTTPSHIPARHSFYERDIGSMRGSLLVTPRLSARRNLTSVHNSEPRPFIAPRLPMRGSPIAEQLNSPVMREKRRERELREMKTKLAAAEDERDLKEMEVKELKKSFQLVDERGHQMKMKLDETLKELTKESKAREEAENKRELVEREKRSLSERNGELTERIKALKGDDESNVAETAKLIERIAHLNANLDKKAREIMDLKDELKQKYMSATEQRELSERLAKELEERRQEVATLTENTEEMKEDWRRQKKKMEEENMEMQRDSHRLIGEMNADLMSKNREIGELQEELENEKKKGEEGRKKKEEEMGRLRDEAEKEKRRIIEEMREKKEKFDGMEEERERMIRENEEKRRELMRKVSEYEVKMIEVDGLNVSLKQKLAVCTSNGETLSLEMSDLKLKTEALSRVNEQLRGTIEGMEKERKEKEGVTERLREAEKKIEEMKEKIERLSREKEEASEKAYSALLDNDRFTQMMEKMKMEEEERIKDEAWRETQLRADIMAAESGRSRAEEERREMERIMESERREREEERMNWHSKTAQDVEHMGKIETELKELKFLQKNESKQLKIAKMQIEKMGGLIDENGEMKETVERMQREMEAMRETGRVNMEMVVGKKKELEATLKQKEKLIEELTEKIDRMKEDRDTSMRDTSILSLATVKRDKVGALVAPRSTTLMDFDEEPTSLYAKSTLDTRQESDYEVDSTLLSRLSAEKMEEKGGRGAAGRGEEKENDTMFLMTPSMDRRTLAPLDSKQRLEDIAKRNAKHLPHMRSSHAVEAMSPNFSQDALREGIVKPASSRRSVFRMPFSKKKEGNQ